MVCDTLNQKYDFIKSLHNFLEKRLNDYSIKQMHRFSIDKKRFKENEYKKSVTHNKGILKRLL